MMTKKTIFGLSLSTLMFVVGCGHSAKKSNGSGANSESSVSTSQVLEMTPADQKYFSEVFNQPANDAVEAIRMAFETYVHTYLLTVADMEKFDARLNTIFKDKNRLADIDILADSSYIRLMARRIELDQQKRQLQLVYGRLTEMAMDPTLETNDRAHARKIRLQVHRYLREKSSRFEMLALAPVVLELAQVEDQVNQVLSRKPALNDADGQRRAPELDGKIVELAGRPYQLHLNHGAAITNQVRGLKGSGDESTVQKLQAQIENEFLQAPIGAPVSDLNLNRGPQSASINGANSGRLTGFEFPRGSFVLTFGQASSQQDFEALQKELEKSKVAATFLEASRANALESSNIVSGVPKVNGRPMQILWNVDALSWLDNNPERIADRVYKQAVIQGRGIIYFDQVRDHTVKASQRLISKFHDGRVQLQKLDDVLGEIHASH